MLFDNVNIRNFMMVTVPEFVMVTVPAKLHASKEVVVKAFMEATPSQQKAVYVALAVLASLIIIGVARAICKAWIKVQERNSYSMLDFISTRNENRLI